MAFEINGSYIRFNKIQFKQRSVQSLSFPDSLTATKSAIVCDQVLSPGLAFISALSLSLHPSLMSPLHPVQTIASKTGSGIRLQGRAWARHVLERFLCDNNQDILSDPDAHGPSSA